MSLSSSSSSRVDDREKSFEATSSISIATSAEVGQSKTWQMIFYTSNIPTASLRIPRAKASTASIKYSFVAMNGSDETEQDEIKMNDFPQCFQSDRQDSFAAKLRHIGQPKQIRVMLDVEGDLHDQIKWHLDRVCSSLLRHSFHCPSLD
uniref:hypothetical protein n=1 Tax=Sphingomonas sp. TaxID=28214 RepID=UPI0025E4B94A|nr:hypothetical protein [Sphingomonas sp.]